MHFDVHIANQDDYKYGKNLQFVHTIESLPRNPDRLRNLSVKWADNNRQFHRSSSYYGYYMGTLEKVRHLELSENELAEFCFDGRKDIAGRIYRNQKHNLGNNQRTSSEKMTITGAKQGIELKVSKFTCGTEQYKICFYDKRFILRM